MILHKKATPALLAVNKIWNQAPHCALTDLIRYKGKWYCTFRESDQHVAGMNGTIRIISSSDGIVWTSCAYFSEDGVDLRDPKLSITPFGKLMLIVCGTVFDGLRNYKFLHTRVSFSDDGKQFDPFRIILEKHEWLWRVTWHQGRAYGAAYSRSDPKDRYKEWNLRLYQSDDGVDYRMITQWDIQGYPNETTLRFLKNNQMVALVRRDKHLDKCNWLGVSQPPYDAWDWTQLSCHVGGPNFLVLPDESMWVAGRILYNTPYAETEKTFVGSLDLQNVHPLLILPSGGDCSYPGMVYHEGILWISYYSSHEGRTAIYLARVAL